MTRKNALFIAATAAAFANPAANQAPAADAKKAGAPKAEDRVTPVFTAIRTDIAMPASTKRGAKSELAVKMQELTVGASIGLVNKTKNQISSTLSKVNNAAENVRNKVDADGKPVTQNGEAIKDGAGTIVGYNQVPVIEKVKEFVAYTVDPKTDPDKAQTRIFRTK